MYVSKNIIAKYLGKVRTEWIEAVTLGGCWANT